MNKEQLPEPNVSKRTPVQKDLEGFVNITAQSFEEKITSMFEKLSAKVDNMSKAQASSIASSSISSKFDEEMKNAYGKMKDWKKVKNIVELVNNIDDLQLYPLSATDTDEFFDGTGAILRCETCFTLFKDKAVRLTPAKAA